MVDDANSSDDVQTPVEAERLATGDAEPAQPAPEHLPASPEDQIPTELIALPLNQRPLFPTMLAPLIIPAGRLADGIRLASERAQGVVGFFLVRDGLEDATAYNGADLLRVGCAARILKIQDHEGGGLQVLVQAIGRIRIEAVLAEQPLVLVRCRSLRHDADAADPEIRACAMAIVTALRELVQHNPVFADEIRMVLSNFNNIDGPGRLADLAATLTTAKREDIQQVLETVEVLPRLELVLTLLAKERQLSEMKQKIHGQITEKISEQQRKFFLTEQLKAIKEELGLEKDEKSVEIGRFQERFATVREAMSAEAVQAVDDELRKLSLLEPASSEYGVSRARLEWLLGLPWGERSDDQLDLGKLKAGLDADHHGLEDVKRRISEFVAVRRLKADKGGGIICLVGPPGTGKTSIGASIARQLGRKFYRLSVGGMRDEAEIKGHRRTYVGALPGKLVQALRRAGSMNPVILLDEIDKMSRGLQGDPAAALLEVLDPEQNKDFLDHYLDIRIDLSQVLFICTANDLSTIPEPLQDRMEVIRLAGYIEAEKVAIAQAHLVPKNRQSHGLAAKDLIISRSGLAAMVRGYAREAGVRRLEQRIQELCRKAAMAKAEALDQNSTFEPLRLGPTTLAHYLGKPTMSDEELLSRPLPGVVTGLAWTALGGATLEVEAAAAAVEPGNGGFTLSGRLGEVMKESAGIARSVLRVNAERYGVERTWLDRHLVHLHVPAGATPKDGPSAGITMATAMLSLALGKPIHSGIGMTGELTLTGRVFPIGGVREKIVAARRSRLRTVILPAANQPDWEELPEHLRADLEVHFVSQLDEVLAITGLFPPAASKPRKRRPAATKAKPKPSKRQR